MSASDNEYRHRRCDAANYQYNINPQIRRPLTFSIHSFPRYFAGLSMIENPEVIGWAKQMQKLRRPMIFNLENWGLADFNLPETTVESSIVKSA